MAFVVPGVARFAINQSMEGRAIVNVLDYVIDTTGSTMSRNDAIEDQAEDIITQWSGTLRGWQADDLSIDSVSYVDLDSASGVTGVKVSSSSVTLPVNGLEAGSPLPGNVAALVTKQAPSARGRRNGRLFLAGITEATTDAGNGNVITGANVTGINSSLATFLANTNNVDTVGTAFSSDLVVVHVTSRDSGGNPLTGSSSVVQSLTVDSLLATQRRRLRG